MTAWNELDSWTVDVPLEVTTHSGNTAAAAAADDDDEDEDDVWCDVVAGRSLSSTASKQQLDEINCDKQQQEQS